MPHWRWNERGVTMGKGKNRLPDRWTDYHPIGQRMPGTRFIAFKVPLQQSFDWKLSPLERFSPLDLINKVKEQKEELGLIIDLTYTTRYYEPEELPKCLSYSKVFTAGHEVPDDKTIYQFKSVVANFLRENEDNDKLIGVHCTHGLNRTGYLICRYLIDVEGMIPSAAIEIFNRCRGHAIERQNYIKDLKHGPIRNNHGIGVHKPVVTSRQEGAAYGNELRGAQDAPYPSRGHHAMASRVYRPWKDHGRARPTPWNKYYHQQYDYSRPTYETKYDWNGPRDHANWSEHSWNPDVSNLNYHHHFSTPYARTQWGSNSEQYNSVPAPHPPPSAGTFKKKKHKRFPPT
ncbi:RNA/RNP complex-1-interacting phosphatase [Microcaecilia unicolor]|uniref:RNA/RNP complex-1-interacting phosphatase n=1 Tax=Microcaecilia unicolor TaxID=1415580 RepID=A0A6P7Y3N6_9AMPH|nr:RNA/RNP complex-1-interacting phosphatase [Microcaecilia unicolor]